MKWVHPVSQFGMFFAALGATSGCDLPEETKGRNLCEIGTLCAEPAPEPIKLQIGSETAQLSSEINDLLIKDIETAGNVFPLEPAQQGWVDQNGDRHFPLRMYFVEERNKDRAGSLWVVFDHKLGERPKSQVLSGNLDRHQIDVVTDGPHGSNLSLYRIAIVDRETRIGPTFVVEHNGRADRRYVSHEYNSDHVRQNWEAAVTSSCGGGPLTAIPPEWENERKRDCKALQGRSEPFGFES